MTAKQNTILRKKMGQVEELQSKMRLFGSERDAQMSKWTARATDPSTVQKRLKHVSRHFYREDGTSSSVGNGGLNSGSGSLNDSLTLSLSEGRGETVVPGGDVDVAVAGGTGAASSVEL